MNTMVAGAAEAKPTLYETDESRYSGPHRWQTSWYAKTIRRLWRRRAYTRWVEEACTSLDVYGLHHLESLDGPAIFVANHQSHLDTLVAYTAMPEPVKRRLFFGAAADRWFVKGNWLRKRRVSVAPWYQSLILGNFPIQRGGGSKALAYAAELLKRGEHVFVFPEGTRATSGSLGRFRAGAVLLAKSQGVPIYPVYLQGLQALRPKGSREVTPGPVEVHFLAPVKVTPDDDVSALLACLYMRMNRAHQQAGQVIEFESVPANTEFADAPPVSERAA